MADKFDQVGVRLSDTVARFVGTWKFIIIYTTSMLLWIALHVYGILSIDSTDFIKWNLWLSYFAGIQASILLMASNRELQKDRKQSKDTWDLARRNFERVSEIGQDLDSIEEILNGLYKDLSEEETTGEQ